MGFECIKLPVVTLPINSSYTMAMPSLVKKATKMKLKSFDPDVIHIATPSLLGNFALKYAGKRDIPVISIYHTHFISYIDYYLKHTPFLISKAKQLIAESQRTFYNKCNQIYIPADTIINELKAIGVEETRMKLWKRGIDTSLFSPLQKDQDLIHQMTGNRHPTIVFASRLVWEKNLETLFRIYDKIQSLGIEVNFLVIGTGVAKKACELKMKNAIFTGKVNHQILSVLYASATVFLFPSVSETYGNVVLEAMASGLPCVIADGGGSADLISHGINGFKCKPYDEDDYVEKIMALLKNKWLRARFTHEGLKNSSNLSWDELAEVYFSDLGDLAKQATLVPA
jgi:glycosyltransferase involved in cell wall biosynthesis